MGKTESRGTFPKANRVKIESTDAYTYTSSIERRPGPGDYDLNASNGAVKTKKGVSFGFKENVNIELEEEEFEKKVNENNMETRGSLNNQNKSMDTKFTDSSQFKPKEPGPTSYNPSFTQVWPNSSRYVYKESVSKKHSRMEKANKILKEKIETQPQRKENDSAMNESKNSDSLSEEDEKPKKKKKKAGTFGTGPKFGLIIQQKSKIQAIPTPGPGAYHTDHETISRRVELEIGAGARLLGKLKELLDNKVPGPGTYSNLNMNVIRKADHGYRMAMGERDTSLTTKINDRYPGPGHYQITDFPKSRLNLSKNSCEEILQKMNSEIEGMVKNKNYDKGNKNEYIVNNSGIKQRRYRMRPGVTFTKAEKKTSKSISKKKKKNKEKEKLQESEVLNKNSSKDELSLDNSPGPNKYDVRKVYEKYFSKPGKSLLKRNGFWFEIEQRSKRDFPGPGEYNIKRELDKLEDYKPSEAVGSKANIINQINLEEGDIDLNDEGHANFDMKIFNGLRSDQLIDINTLVQHKKNREKRKEVQKNLDTLAEIAQKQKLAEKNLLETHVKGKKKKKISKKSIFNETQKSENSFNYEEDSPNLNKKSKFSNSQIMHLRAQSYINSHKKSQLLLRSNQRKKKKQPGASFSTSVRPFMRKSKSVTPGPGQYDLREGIGSKRAVNWGKPKRSSLEKISNEIFQELGDVGPTSYNIKSTFPQVQDWERWKLENKKF